MTSSSLTDLRQAALALWRHQRRELERDAAKHAAELALDVFGDTAGPLADHESWKGNADGDAVAMPTLDEDGADQLEYDHTFDEQLWLRSDCPACGGSSCRITPIGSLLELGQALDRLQEARTQLAGGDVGVEVDDEEDEQEGGAEVADTEVDEDEEDDAEEEVGVAVALEIGAAVGATVVVEIDADDLPGACDDCEEANGPAQRLYQAVLDAIEEAGEDEDEDEEAMERPARGRG